jgi:hypothetical protein
MEKMKNKSNIKLDLMPAEQHRLKTHKIRALDIIKYTIDELSTLLNVPMIRAMEIHALVEFQSIPSIGIKFAKDLISLGYYSLEELKDKDGANLIEDLEILTGAWIDPCVEDQCRLVVHYANNRDDSKKWWDFTEERKKYRIENGYPSNRPVKPWSELEKYSKK